MKENGIVVGINIENIKGFEESIVELKNLCLACNIETVGELIQNAKKINKATYVGSGKIEELRILVQSKEADVVIFNNDLTTSQLRSIEDAVKCRVIDRTALILDIFAERAKTRESKLQVQVARLQYLLPRLIGANENLGRQGGAFGIRNKGAGETKLELTHRNISDKIAFLNKELEDLKHERKMQRNKRNKSNIPSVALVGYTNSGKSTLMNSILDMVGGDEGKKVFEKDMLFATLDTSVRSIKLKDNKKFLLSDTVGFVSNLPHDLVKAFRSTLEEVCEADLLIHVVDITNEDYKNNIKVTLDTLKEIGAEDVPMVYAFNKIDLLDTYKKDEEGVYISAKLNNGIDELLEEVCSKVFKDYVTCNMVIPYERGNVVSYLSDNTKIVHKEYKEEGTALTIECSKIDYNRYNEYVI